MRVADHLTSSPVLPSEAETAKTTRHVIGWVQSVISKQDEEGEQHFLVLMQGNQKTRWPLREKTSAVRVGTLVRLLSDGCFIPLEASLPEPLIKRLYQQALDPRVIDRLLAVVGQVSHPSLSRFVSDVFADDQVLNAWLRIPASRYHHHAWPGGLIAHSVECAHWLAAWSQALLPPLERDITLIAGLFHDIGKIHTLTEQGHWTAQSQAVGHEVLGLQVLTHALENLRHSWPHGADALMHMLSWKPSQQEPLPRLPGVTLLRQADQLSTVMDLREHAFKHKPASFYWAKPKTASKQRFYRVMA